MKKKLYSVTDAMFNMTTLPMKSKIPSYVNMNGGWKLQMSIGLSVGT